MKVCTNAIPIPLKTLVNIFFECSMLFLYNLFKLAPAHSLPVILVRTNRNEQFTFHVVLFAKCIISHARRYFIL